MEKLSISNIDSQTLIASTSDRPVVFGVDGKFMGHSLITILSVIQHAGNTPYHFHIVSSELDATWQAHYLSVLAGTPHGLSVHLINDALFDALPTTTLFTRATYYRLLAPLLLAEASKVLYLDADIVCLNPLDALWQKETGPDAIALVVSEIETLHAGLARDAGLQHKRYFNAGVMLIDVAEWNRARISEQALDTLQIRGKNLKYLDQDALNLVLEGRVNYIETRFNTIMMLSHDSQGYTLDVPAETCLLHYAGADKPWQIWNQQFVCRHYRQIYQRSPLADLPFDAPKTSQQAKRMYKRQHKNNQFFSALYWRYKYYQMRYF